MKIGDLVKHNPDSSTYSSIRKMYGDFEYGPDFSIGIIVALEKNHAPKGMISRGGFASVVPCAPLRKPHWYQIEELEVLSEGR